MSKLNQALLKFELEQNFAYDDFFVSKCNYFAFNLIKRRSNAPKKLLDTILLNYITSDIIVSYKT